MLLTYLKKGFFSSINFKCPIFSSVEFISFKCIKWLLILFQYSAFPRNASNLSYMLLSKIHFNFSSDNISFCFNLSPFLLKFASINFLLSRVNFIILSASSLSPIFLTTALIMFSSVYFKLQFASRSLDSFNICIRL